MTNDLPMCASVGAEVEMIADEDGTEYRYSAESCANARLMAAAPELLAELRRAVTWMETLARLGKVGDDGPLMQDIATARAAISKASGE